MTGVKSLRIAPAGAADLDAAAQLIRQYADSLPIDLNRQGFADEIASLPGPYAPPDGALLLAFQDGEALGSIALKRLEHQVGEIKLLYVARAGRGLGIGKSLVAALLAEAGRIGYREIKLDTLPHMTEAIALYKSFGFEPIEAYGSFPYPGLLCFGRRLK
jgi:ribosomal protein S18 acetylase RimI-like enzyme